MVNWNCWKYVIKLLNRSSCTYVYQTWLLNIQIPSPGAYLIQKFIIRGDRRPAYLQKDCFYMYELLLKFNTNLSELALSVENVIFYNDKKTNYSKVKSFKTDFVTTLEVLGSLFACFSFSGTTACS